MESSFSHCSSRSLNKSGPVTSSHRVSSSDQKMQFMMMMMMMMMMMHQLQDLINEDQELIRSKMDNILPAKRNETTQNVKRTEQTIIPSAIPSFIKLYFNNSLVDQ